MKLIASVTALAVALPVWAMADAMYPDFKAKMEKVPAAGEQVRTLVQIDPNAVSWTDQIDAYTAQLEPLPTPEATILPEGTPPEDVSKTFEWYWDLVPPGTQGAGEGRIIDALAALEMAPEGEGAPYPRLQRMQNLVDAYGTDILKATIGTRVSPALVLAVMSVESAGKSDAVSPAGAQGLMQLIPDTAKRFNVADATDPGQNIAGGVAYLDWLLTEFNGDPVLALAGYNAGENAVKSNSGVPPYAETRAYVPKVLAAFQVAKALCMTPPQFASDGCVFGVQVQASNE